MKCTSRRFAARGAALVLAGACCLAPLAATAGANGVTDGEVAFGMSCALSGPAKELGRQMKVGIEIAFSAQNDTGGVHGRKLSLVALDDGYEPERTRAAMKELVERRKVFGIVGNVGTPTAAVAVPYALDKGLLFYGAFTGADLLRNDPPDRFVFNYRASYAEETAAMVKYLVEVRRIKPSQIAVFAQEDAYGDAGFEGVASMMRKLKRDPAQVVRVGYKRNTTDVAEAVKTIKQHAAGIRAIIMVPTYKAAARFIQRIRDEKVDAVLLAVSFVGSNELAEQLLQLGARYADGVIVTQVVPLPTSRASAIIKYQQALARYAPSEKPDFVSLEGYLAATLLSEGLQRAGKELTTDTLIAALEGIKGLDLGIGAPLSFGPSEHQASHKVWGSVLGSQGVYTAIRLE
jgi:branched-chain amino acid transport system substrate-binding protein